MAGATPPFQDLIKQLRREAGLAQTELAERLGMAQRTVSSWETGDAVPRPRVIRKLARVLRYPEAELMIAANLARTAAEARRIAESDRPVYDERDPRNQIASALPELDDEEARLVLDVIEALKRRRPSGAARIVRMRPSGGRNGA